MAWCGCSLPYLCHPQQKVTVCWALPQPSPAAAPSALLLEESGWPWRKAHVFGLGCRGRAPRSGSACLSMAAVPSVACSATTAGKRSGSISPSLRGLRGRRHSLLGLADRISAHPWLSLQGPRDFAKTLGVGLLSGQSFQINGLFKWEALWPCLELGFFWFVFVLFCSEVY